MEGRRLEGTLSPHRRDWVGRSVEGGEKTRGYLVSSQTCLLTDGTGLGGVWREGRRLEGTLSPHRRDWVEGGGEKTRGRSVEWREGRRLEGTLSPHRQDWVGRSVEGGEKTRGYLVSSQTGLGWEECGGRGRGLEGTLSPHRRDWVGGSVEGGGED